MVDVANEISLSQASVPRRRRLKRRVLFYAAILCVVALMLWPQVWAGQSLDEMLLFHPSKHPVGDWQPVDLDFEDLTCEAADKTRIHGWFCPARKPKGVLLWSHGNAGNVTHRVELLRVLQQRMQISVYLFDYRGYGKSQGKPTVEGALQDARAARAALAKRAKVKESELILMGESLGGAIAIQLASEQRPRALIVQSSFSSLREVGAVHMPQLAWIVNKDRLNSRAHIAKYTGPLLISHGTADEVIPFSQGEALFAAANEPKGFLEIPGGTHNDWLNEEYLQTLQQFFDDLPPAK